MADALNDVQKRFDKLVKDIISHINRIINKLKKEKENTIRIYKAEVHEYYLSRREAVQNRRAEFDTLAKEREAQIPAEKRGEFDGLVAQINALREELEKLLEREMQIEELVGKKVKDEPARIEKEIELMNSLLDYIKSHVKVGKLFSRGRLISPLNTKAIYERIKGVYDEVKSRETEKKAVEYYLEMKKEIEQKSDGILSRIKKLMAILGAEEKAVSPEAVEKKEKAVKKAKEVLKREENYFMLFSDIVKQLYNVAASKIHPKRKLEQARSLLKKLERFEKREQWRASVSNLKRKLDKLLEIPSINPLEKQEVEKDVRELRIFEGDVLVKTVRELGEKIKGGKGGVQAEQVNWQEFIGILSRIERDIQAAIAIDQRLDKLLESEKKGIRGRVGAGLGAAGRVAGGAAVLAGRGIGRARSGIGTARLRAVMAKENIGREIGGAIGRLPNPIPSLKNWASSVDNTAKKLRDKIRRGQDTSQERAKAAAAEVSGPEVETRVNILLQIAQSIRNFDPGKSARLTGLANRLRELKNGIVARLRNLRRARTPQEAEQIIVEVEQEVAQLEGALQGAETELQQIIMQNVRGTPTGITQEWAEAWLRRIMPNIDFKNIDAETIARQMKPGVAERTQRSKDTNLHGSGRGFKSNARYSGGQKRPTPRNLRTRPYDRNQAR